MTLADPETPRRGFGALEALNFFMADFSWRIFHGGHAGGQWLLSRCVSVGP